MTREVAEAFHGGRLVTLENSGHTPMIEEAAATTAALAEFVSEFV